MNAEVRRGKPGLLQLVYHDRGVTVIDDEHRAFVRITPEFGPAVGFIVEIEIGGFHCGFQ